MTVAWFHCFSGIAGDMALGSLVDAGADLDEVRTMLGQLPVGGWSVEAEPVLRGGIAGTKVHVHAEDTTVVRTAAHIQGLVAEARLPDRVQRRAAATFARLADAEGRLHRRPPDQVHFHEVGGIDAIVDVVGTCAALEVLGVDTVTSSPIAVGLGMVRAAHGIIPNPAPAVVELLTGIPTRGIDLAVELTTPTGAALVAALAEQFGALPPMISTSSGFGAGTREIDDRPNLVQVVIGEPISERIEGGQPVVVLEANVDDATGEVLAHAVASLLEAGAHDAWVTPIIMKKGRPAHTIHALADIALASRVRGVLAAETGTLGVRGQQLERWPMARTVEHVLVDDLSVRVKVSPGRVKAEYDDAARVARVTGRPVRDVLAEAEARWRADDPTGVVTQLHAPEPLGDDPPPDAGRDHDHQHDHDHDHDHDHPHDHDPYREHGGLREADPAVDHPSADLHDSDPA
ncbi:MAG: Pyridinium-3,5-bisthiocarboxylic acid mononucleotide nickel insertion protein [Acidimicrobiales bacterium]|nr:Pyridinium-3,5-bisthiocarboxylic acid mononucleotide nickel insertion protein [Acidimicrobiales bacterium]